MRERHTIVACEDWIALTRTCEREPVHLVVFDLYADGRADFERVRQVKLRAPSATFLAYIAYSQERARDVFDAGRLGIDGLVVADQDDTPGALLSLIERAEARGIAGMFEKEFERALGRVRPTVRDAALVAVTRAHERMTPDGLARVLATSRRRLAQRLSNAGFPPPHRLLVWGRLIVAAHLLEDAQRTADGVARVLQFPSGSAFRNTCQRYVHATPQQIRARGGAQYIIRALLRQIAPATSTAPLSLGALPLRGRARQPNLAV
ncbi:MAG TPA: helix-turn-helix domain-containing protein [Gemmatimonadaceae bacterium]|nr:helix-turn-helix domain-containing protein [Gemmatimonadaceae bacterium]